MGLCAALHRVAAKSALRFAPHPLWKFYLPAKQEYKQKGSPTLLSTHSQ